jgi:hypothetical protein
MSTQSRALDRFLRAVRRRWVLVRAAEHVGACVLGGCAVALLLLPILLWRGEPALPVVSMILLIAVVAGLIAGFVRRPDLMSAAAEVDRQLDLADLLSTALATRSRSSADPWADVVLATANARCSNLSANDVILNRFGARTWGGIGLAGALVLTLALMSANPRNSMAVVTRRSSVASSEKTEPSRDATQRSSSRGGAPSRHDATGSSAPDFAPAPDDTAAATANQGDASRNTGSTSFADGGAGMATSDAPTSTSQRVSAQAQSRGSGQGDASAGGRQTAISSRDPRDENAGDSTRVSPAAAPVAPAWQSPSWPAARDEALSAVRDGRIADEYHDLVHAYFDQSQP